MKLISAKCKTVIHKINCCVNRLQRHRRGQANVFQSEPGREAILSI